MGDLVFNACPRVCVEQSWTEYTIFGYVSGLLALLLFIFLIVSLTQGYSIKPNKKQYSILAISLIIFSTLFVLYTETSKYDPCGSSCSRRASTQVELMPTDFTDISPVSFPSIPKSTMHILDFAN